MRNLTVYPINTQDILNSINVSIERNRQEKLIGSTTGISLCYLREFIELHQVELQEFLKTKEI